MNITKHAFDRMTERGMTPEMLASLMKGRKLVWKSENGRFVVVGSADGKLWTVVMESDLYTVVTVRRAHKNEEAVWNSR
jgi:hypothetical protein